MRAGMHRHSVPGQVKAETKAGLVDARKSPSKEIRVPDREIQIDTSLAASFQLLDDASGDDVPRCQLSIRMEGQHEPLPLSIAQHCPLPPQGLREKKAGRAGREQGGGVELHELQIRQRCPSAVGHGHAVPRGLRWVGGFTVEASRPSRRQEHGARTCQSHLTRGLVQQEQSRAALSFEHQIHAQRPTEEGQRREAPGARQQCPDDFHPCGIAMGMQHSPATVRTLPCKGESRSFPIEPRTPIDQLLDPLGTFLHEHPHCLSVTESVPGAERVLQVKLDPIFFGKGGGDSTLSVAGIAVGGIVLGHEGYSQARSGQIHSRS